jgi:hypothetical protein
MAGKGYNDAANLSFQREGILFVQHQSLHGDDYK